MNNTLKNIPKQFLDDKDRQKKQINDIYVNSKGAEAGTGDNIWLLLILIILFDIV